MKDVVCKDMVCKDVYAKVCMERHVCKDMYWKIYGKKGECVMEKQRNGLSKAAGGKRTTEDGKWIMTGGKRTTAAVKRTAAFTAAIVLAAAPVTSYGFQMIGEYYEISCQEANAFMFDGTTAEAGTTGQLVLSKLESSWASGSSIRTTDISVITAKVVPGDNGLNVIEYTAKSPGTAQLIVVVESGAAVNMGNFYVTAASGGQGTDIGWIQENGQWKYKMGDGTYKDNGWFADNGKWYYLGPDGTMYASQWLQDGEWWYYLGADGAMLKDTVTPDGYQVNDYGVWEP